MPRERPTIPYARQSISARDITAVARVLRSDWLTQGPAIAAFEGAIAARVHAGHAVAVCNATAALHISCLALGLGPGDRLWTSPISFAASANCGRYCGAEVDFVDIHPDTYNLCPDALADKLRRAARDNRLPKIVVPVHLAGQSCDMDRIFALSRKYGFRVLEDASHAIGGEFAGQPVGGCRYADAAVFSFHPVKIITTGEGGMITTNNRDLAEHLRLLRSHGITRDQSRFEENRTEPWYYEQQDLGFNYRLTDLQAALGHSQLARIDAFLAKRTRLAARYDKGLRSLPLSLPVLDSRAKSAWHLYIIRLGAEFAGTRRTAVAQELRRRGITVNMHYLPIHTHPYYRRLGFKPGDFPQAERYAQEALSLPLFYDLSRADQDYIIANLHEILAG